MRATTPRFYVRDDEDVVLSTAPTPGAAVARVLTGAIALTVLLGAVYVADRFVDVPPLVFTITRWAYAALVVLTAFMAWRWLVTSEYVITNARIYARHGRLRTSVHFTTHDKVTDIQYHQGVIQRVVGVSTVKFMTAGGDVAIEGVRDALAVKETAESTRDDFIQRLLERAGVDAHARRAGTPAPEPGMPAPSRAPAPVRRELPPLAPLADAEGKSTPEYVKKGDRMLWTGKPRDVAALATALPILGAVAFFGVGSLTNPTGFFMLPVILGIGALVVGFRVLQYRHTEYVVSDKRVYVRSGIIGTTVKQLTYEKITDITYSQDVLGRVLGYAGVTVNTAGSNEAPAVMVGLWNALDVKELIEKARARALDEDEDDTPEEATPHDA